MYRAALIVMLAVTAALAVALFSTPAQAGTVQVPLDDSLTDIRKCGTVCQESANLFSCSAQCEVRRPDGGQLAEVTVSATASTPTGCLVTLRTACRSLVQ